MNIKRHPSARRVAQLIFMTYLMQAGAVCGAAMALWVAMMPGKNDVVAVVLMVIDFALAWACSRVFMRQAALRGLLRTEYERIRGPWNWK